MLLPLLLRALAIVALLCATGTYGGLEQQREDRVEQAPVELQPASQQREQHSFKLPALACAPRLPKLLDTGVTLLRPVAASVPPRERTCAHRPGARVHVPRRAVPRLRDDLGDP